MSVWAIVVAAGSGTRFGAPTPKQFLPIAGRRVVDWSVRAARSASDGVVVVVPAQGPPVTIGDADAVVPGGATRSASVRAGLAVVPPEATIIVVHDAARPAADPPMFRRVIGAVRDIANVDGAIAAVPVVDTVKRVDGPNVIETLARDTLVAVQTPQAFRADVLRRAHATGAEATDDAALVEAAGGRIVHVAGDPGNRKITTPEDVDALARTLGTMNSGLRVGTGFDVHPFSPDQSRRLVLGGVVIGDGPGLAGHSDADAVAHAITDALLGAAGLGDIGQHFPDTDDRWKGADSMVLLGATVELLHREGWTPVNVDCTVVLEAPKLAPHRDAMQQRLSGVVGAPVAVKAKRAEGLGALGRREGIACHAVALLQGGPMGPAAGGGA